MNIFTERKTEAPPNARTDTAANATGQLAMALNQGPRVQDQLRQSRILNGGPGTATQAKLASALANRPVQRMCRACAEEEETVQTKSMLEADSLARKSAGEATIQRVRKKKTETSKETEESENEESEILEADLEDSEEQSEEEVKVPVRGYQETGKLVDDKTAENRRNSGKPSRRKVDSSRRNTNKSRTSPTEKKRGRNSATEDELHPDRRRSSRFTVKRDRNENEGSGKSSPPKKRRKGKNGEELETFDAVVEGEGVRFTTDNTNWHNGYCTKIQGDQCSVFIEGKIAAELYPTRTIWVPLNQVVTNEKIRADLGKKKTKASKTEWSASELASEEEIKEAQPLHSAVSPFLLANPAFFGLVLRSGGFTGLDEFRKVAKSSGIDVIASVGSRGKSKNKELDNAIVATDTSALLATRLDDLETGPGEWTIHGRAEEEDAEDHPKLTESQLAKVKELDLADFRSTYIFQQGSTGNEVITLPPNDKRTKLHAEAKAVRSLTWQHIVDETILEFSREEEESLVEEVSVKPETKRKIISIVINRSSCGSSKKGSGYGYGCAKELGDVITEFWDTLADHLGEERTARLRSEGLIQIEISVGGQYEFEGDLQHAANAGATTRLHPNYNYALNSPEPLTKARYKYIKTLAELSKGDTKASGELAKLLAQIRGQRKSTRTPVTSVHAPFGQADVFGLFNPHHSGRIACTSIAACALEQFLTSPGGLVSVDDLWLLLAAGTDIDAEVRKSAPGGIGEKSSGDEEILPTFGEGQVKLLEDDEPLVTSSVNEESLPTFGQSSAIPVEDDEPLISSEVTSKNPLFILSQLLPSQSDSQVQIPQTITGQRPAFEDDDRYFAHDEVQEHFPAIEVNEDTLEEIGPQYLYGLRGDYRRIARQLTRMGRGNGLLVTIGGATIAVANLTPLVGDPVYALFDSHGRAIFETYDTEEGLTDAIEDLYPALPGLDDEVATAWYATPYRPTK